MPRYVDADKLLYKRVWVAATRKEAVKDAVVVFAGEIDKLALATQTTGVVKVVRCKDCKDCRTDDNTEYCACQRYKILKRKDGYCDLGDAKEGENR